jgi:transposase
MRDEEWRVIEPHLPAAKSTSRPPAWPLREIVNGILPYERLAIPKF